MSDYLVFHRLYQPLVIMMISAILLFAMIIIHFQSANADECGVDVDWQEKPCPAYGAESGAELRERWDEYYEMKGEERMEAKKAEMDAAIKEGSFTEWIKNAPDNNFANRNVYFYYRLNDQAPLMVYDLQSGRYFMPEEQDPSKYPYSAMSGDYYVQPPSPPWYTGPEGIYVIIGTGSAGALASFYAIWKVMRN
jgi:hypothetical protein